MSYKWSTCDCGRGTNHFSGICRICRDKRKILTTKMAVAERFFRQTGAPPFKGIKTEGGE